MLQKWKDIIANWINCYFNESDKREERVTLESLLNIISHLRENLSLDESKSSILEAHTVEEFVREKYPDFRFNNGSADASSEDEIYVVASLLLYFVCVNSKDLDIKHAMCSQLSSEDQEIILKFSKCLMECAPVTYKDVQAAITEACGQDSSSIGPSSSRLVSETPPALRSLHGEVRRLQAALDAERFDRNYLQEELARTNLKVEKLAKDKEQYKLEMVNLKAKISMCCGQEKDAQAGDAAAEGTAKLMRQLEEVEERLVQTQGLLDDAQYERDAYKAKINELKQERDKWVAESQEEAARASQLCSELEAERRQVQSLTEIVAELRQHNQLNRLDSSLLECDDPDASVHSLHHNMSVCSEACANVVEVQLSEERAKMVVLKQQIQSVQDQLNDLTLKSETEKQSLEKVITERENDIFDLKHRINEEIEEKNNMTIHFSDAMSKLNNEINELEQKLKDNNQQCRMVVEAKMQEIQTLQEEKLSLLQSLTDETNKLENVIKTLKSELDAEKASRVKMRDDYENHIMKLNEKVLNRNNELVELQNDVFEKSDKIEALHLELRKEKQAKDELLAKHHNECEEMNEMLLERENTIKNKCEEIARLTERLNYNFEFIKELGREVDELKYAVSEQSESCRVLEGTKITMSEELHIKDEKLEELQKHLENMKNVHSEEKDRLEKDLDETAATVNSLQMQLHEELQFKIGLQDDYAQLEHTKTLISKEFEKIRDEVNKLQNEIQHKDKTIEGMDLFLQEEKLINEKIKQECQNMNEKIKELTEDVVVKSNEIKVIENELAEARKTFEEELRVKHDNIEAVSQKLSNVIEEKEALEIKLNQTHKEIDTISNELSAKDNEILKLQENNNSMNEKIKSIKKSSQALHLKLKKQKQAKDEILAKHRDECELMNEKLLEKENTIKLQHDEIGRFVCEVDELKNAVSDLSKNCSVLEETKITLLEENKMMDRKLEELQNHFETMKKVHTEEQDKLNKDLNEAAATVNALQIQLHEEFQFKTGLQDDYAQLEHTKTSLSKEVELLKEEVNKLQNETQHKDKTIEGMHLILQEEKLINEKVKQECQNLKEKIVELTEDVVVKNNEIQAIENELAEARKMYEEELLAKHNDIESVNQKLSNLIEEKEALEIKLDNTLKERDNISYELSGKVNEILKLQENMTEIIESNKKSSQDLHLEVQKEKQERDKLVAKHRDEFEKMNNKLMENENTIKLKCEEITMLEKLASEVDELKSALSDLCIKCRVLEETKTTQLEELQSKDKKLEELHKHLETMENEYSDETDKLRKDLDEAAAAVNDLQMQLHGELQFKTSLQDDYAQLEQTKTSLSKEVGKLREEVNKLQGEIQHKDKTIEGMDLFFQEENLIYEKVKQECQNLKEEVKTLSEDVVVKNNEIKAIEKELTEVRKTFEEELRLKHEYIESVNQKISNTIEEKEVLEMKLKDTFKERDMISNELSEKVHEILKLEKENKDMNKIIESDEESSQALHLELKKEKQVRDELVANHNIVSEQMNRKLLESENTIKLKCAEIASLTERQNNNLELIEKLGHEIEELKHTVSEQSVNCRVFEETKIKMLEELQMKEENLEVLQKQLETTEKIYTEQKDKLEKDLNEATVTISALQMQLREEIQFKTSLQDEYNQLENNKTLLSKEAEILREEVNKLQNEIQHKDKTIEGMDLFFQEEKLINEKVQHVCQNLNEKIRELSEDLIVKNNKIKAIENELAQARKTFEQELRAKHDYIESVNQQLFDVIEEKESLEMKLNQTLKERDTISKELSEKVDEILKLQEKNNDMNKIIESNNKYIDTMEKINDELKIKLDSQQTEFANKVDTVTKEKDYEVKMNMKLKDELDEIQKKNKEIQEKVNDLTNQIKELFTANDNLRQEKTYHVNKAEELKIELETVSGSLNKEIERIQAENTKLKTIFEESKIVITKLQQTIKQERDQSNEFRLGNDNEKLNLNNKCSLLQEYQMKAERQMEDQLKDIAMLHDEIKTLKSIAEIHDNDLKKKCDIIKEKDEQINNINKRLAELDADKEKNQAELESKITEVNELKHKLNSAYHEDVQKALRSEEWVKAIGQKETFAVAVSEKTGSHKNSCHIEKEYREFQHQVDNTTSDLTHSSMESIKTISDLEKIIYDKNRTITTLQSDITYLKSLVADSQNKLLDITKELEVSQENCQQLSGQLKKIVHQKNEEIAELKKQLNKMTVTENRASQIIKVSAKYQAIILKRIAEIKSNTVLKELTNFGNSANGDNELRRSLNAGTVTMEDLENFLETTDKHLKRCSEKQLALQKERDRLIEVNRINESEIINLKKFLTELSVSFKTFSTVKDLYAQKFSRVVSVQRTVRREILSLEGHVTDATMCKLERGYAAVMQDLSECVMNMERWVERSIGRTISPEKIKQAFTNSDDRVSLASTTFQNTGLEVQLEELENSFQKLLEEVVRAQKGEGARDAQSVTVMEVRAEYEDKLNRMKAKMKQLYQEQISVYKEKQQMEVLALERELAKTRERLAESSKAYEEHIRALTAELWSVGEKFLTKKDEVDWLRKKQRTGSLMSLQHVHSSGLVPPPEEPSRPSDTHSLRSLPVHNTNANKRDKEGRGLHMSDEEGEVFDNRWLKELASTPRRAASPPRASGLRLSELRWRNSLCPPHLKSSYPAETQFQPVLDEEDIKFSLGNTSLARAQRKEVGITAYKKPGPPTPSKNAGRLSATDSELRESLRVEAEPQPSRKTSTPSRLRSLFRSNKNDTAEGTPRSRRLSIFRKK